MNDQERACALFLQRWREQLATSFIPRRARTSSVCSAIEETVELAERWLRSGGQTKPALDPDDAGHGVHMLPDVVAEARDVAKSDRVLELRFASTCTVVREALQQLDPKKPEDLRASALVLGKLLPGLRRNYLAEGFGLLLEELAKPKPSQLLVLELAQAIVSELRAIGFSDVALLEMHREAGDLPPIRAVECLGAAACRDRRSFACYVAVHLPDAESALPTDDASLSFLKEAPDYPVEGRALKRGAYLKVEVEAFDAHAAATVAHQRVLSTVGAITVFVADKRVDVASDVVGVEVGAGKLRTFELKQPLPVEPRSVELDTLARIVGSSWRASAEPASDALHDAIRLRHRALRAHEPETQLLLLWTAIERLTSGARGFSGGALSAAKELVSHAVTLGKLRRDVGDFCACLEHAAGEQALPRLAQLVGTYDHRPGSGPRLHRRKVLERFLNDKLALEELLAPVYEEHPLLAMRADRLWKDLGEGKAASRGKAVASYLERSRTRIARQVARIYRARNRVAHLGAPTDRTSDLVYHAHFYLTQLIAICIHHAGSEQQRPQALLLDRMAMLQAYVSLLRAGDPEACSPDALLRPSLLLDAR